MIGIAILLVREVQRGGYDVVTTAELKQWMDAQKDMVIVDTMPYEDSYKKIISREQFNLCFPSRK